ncbi:MAG: hypothetical protein HQL78_10975, partial [Magnetococcales bacterium]|nr:hypothetical protein [Magnetococcales bacterium]
MMKLQNRQKILPMVGLACLFTVTTSGCGGGSGSSGGGTTTVTSGTPAPVLVGQFTDGPTTGLTYRTSSNNAGTTDTSGQFTYVNGETISFYLGGLLLGSTTAKGVVTPMDLFSDGHMNQDEVVNLSRFLQTLDEDGNPDNGISISAQAKAAAAVRFSAGGNYANFFKTNGHGDGFAQNLATGEAIATKGLESFFKDAGIFRYKKSNWLESSDIVGYLVPKSFAVNHLRGTVQKSTESWSMALTPVQSTATPSTVPITGRADVALGNTTTVSQSSDLTTSGTASLSIMYPTASTSSTTSTTSSTTNTSTFTYYDPNTNPLMDGTLTFPGVTLTVVPSALTSSSTSSTSSSTTTTSTTSSSTSSTTTASTQPVEVTGTVSVAFTGATVTMVNKSVAGGANLGQLNIELLSSSSKNTATFTPDATTTTTLSFPTSGITSLVMKATVNLDTGEISNSTYAVKLSDTTWQNTMKVANIYGGWSRGSDSGNLIFNELYRGVVARQNQKTWELFGIGYTGQEMVAELASIKGAYTQLSTNQTNLKLLTDSTLWKDSNNPIALNGYVGFQIMIYDPSVLVDKLAVWSDSGVYFDVSNTDVHTMGNGVQRYANLYYSNMASTKELSTILSKDLSEDPPVSTTSTTSTTTTSSTTASKTSSKTWGIADATVGPGMISVVFTKNALLSTAGFTFESALSDKDKMIM